MIAVLSPAKTLDFSQQEITSKSSMPDFLEEASILAEVLKKYSPKKLGNMMKINPKLAQLNFERYQEWDTNFVAGKNAKQALLSFKGDVFTGIDANNMEEADLDFAHDHIRILSGLYGVLRPLDLIRPYRLEMGAPLKYRRKNNLYEFWGDKLSKKIAGDVQSNGNVLVNLASQEYFKSIENDLPDIRIISPVFKDFKNGEYKFIHVLGKKARGLMTRFIIKNRINEPEKMKLFDYEGYEYNDRMSKGDKWVFTRG